MDKKLLQRASNSIANDDYKNAEKQLRKVSSEGEKTVEYLLIRADCNEKLTAYNISASDYNTLYSKTKNIEFKKKAEVMTMQYQNKLMQEKLIRNCSICHGMGRIYENKTCNTCNGERYLKVFCTGCNGRGNVKCNNCSGSGKIIRVISSASDGQKVMEESVCNSCSGSGERLCYTCHGNQQQTIKCSYCNGAGQMKTAVKCWAHS